jgi:hypothetical protein
MGCTPPGTSVWWAPALEEPDKESLFSSAITGTFVEKRNHRVFGRRRSGKGGRNSTLAFLSGRLCEKSGQRESEALDDGWAVGTPFYWFELDDLLLPWYLAMWANPGSLR